MKRKTSFIFTCFFSFIFFFASTSTPWDGTVIAFDTSEGKGETVEAPILIKSAQHLAYLAQEVNKGIVDGGSDYENKYFKLTTDIESASIDSIPIGWHVTNANNRHFKGNFDGNNHVITNLYITNHDFSSYSTCALFGAVNGGSVKNLGIGEGSAVTVGSIAAGIVASLSNKGRIDNCYNLATVEGTSYAGGIVAYTTGAPYISNCYNRGEITVRSTVAGPRAVGGVLGATTTAWVSYCYNTGPVSVNGVDLALRAGGLCGSYYDKREPVKSYFLEGSAPPNGNSIGISLSESQMLNVHFLDSLNGDQLPAIWVEDRNNINDGFPILFWQNNNPTSLITPEIAKDSFVENYPNPVREATVFTIRNNISEDISIKLYYSSGQFVSVICDGYFPKGEHEIEFKTNGLMPGIYMYRIEKRGTVIVRKMVVL